MYKGASPGGRVRAAVEAIVRKKRKSLQKAVYDANGSFQISGLIPNALKN